MYELGNQSGHGYAVNAVEQKTPPHAKPAHDEKGDIEQNEEHGRGQHVRGPPQQNAQAINAAGKEPAVSHNALSAKGINYRAQSKQRKVAKYGVALPQRFVHDGRQRQGRRRVPLGRTPHAALHAVRIQRTGLRHIIVFRAQHFIIHHRLAVIQGAMRHSPAQTVFGMIPHPAGGAAAGRGVGRMFCVAFGRTGGTRRAFVRGAATVIGHKYNWKKHTLTSVFYLCSQMNPAASRSQRYVFP